MISISRLNVPHDKFAEFCHRHHIRKLSFFGSVLRSDFQSDSDVDVLVEFEPGHVPGFAFFLFFEELSNLIGCNVDLHTPQFLSRYFRNQVLSEAMVQYER